MTSIIYECLAKEELEIMREYGLEPFEMKTQMLSRTFIDKLFAVCDYYMIGKPVRNSRHLYDIYRLKENVIIDRDFRTLVSEVREHRKHMGIKIAPSAGDEVDVLEIAHQLIQQDFYENDYTESTLKLITENVEYKAVKNCYLEIMEKVFDYN